MRARAYTQSDVIQYKEHGSSHELQVTVRQQLLFAKALLQLIKVGVGTPTPLLLWIGGEAELSLP